MAVVARRLGELKAEVVFVGGAVLGLLIDDTAGSGVRPTDDLDLIVDVASWSEYYELEARLRDRGFKPDITEGAPQCRWRIDGIVVDIMPTEERILGFTNAWYREAIAGAVEHQLEAGLTIRLVSAPHFIATKLEAFAARGGGDFMMSHDLEDVIAVVDGRASLLAEISASSEPLREYLRAQIRTLLADRAFVAALPGHLPGDVASQARVPLVLERLRRIAGVDGT